MSAKFGYLKRKENRKASLKQVGNHAQHIIEMYWSKYQPITDRVIDYYQQVDHDFKEKFTTAESYRTARIKLLRFIRQHNQQNSQLLPEPAVPLRLQRAQPVKDLNWLTQGRALSLLIDQAIQYWQHNAEYSREETLGWTLLSAIMFGGLNDEAALDDFLNALLEARPIERWLDEQHILHLSAQDAHYGNYLQEDILTRSYIFVIDDVTRCWLLRLQVCKPKAEKKFDTVQLLNIVLKKLDSTIKITSTKELKKLLSSASYHWEQVLGARVDGALYRVAIGQQANCSLTQAEFSLFCQPVLSNIDQRWEPDEQKLFKGDFPVLERRKVPVEQKYARALTTVIRQTLEMLHPENTLDQLAEQQNNEAAKRLVAWVLELVIEGKLKNSSILRYMDAVAHPWLILTLEIDILEFEAIDYEDVYQEIISNKSIAGQSFDAKQLDRFHKFQVKKFNAPPVNFNIRNNKQVCRARIVSPLAFRAMCDTVKQALGIDEHHRRVFLLILILAYRTGMRREEIIGLQFKDIERGEQLSFIVRANTSGGIKTNSAYRRIPIYALLNPDELKLLRDYLLSHYTGSLKRTRSPVFSAANSHFPLPRELPSRLFKTLINHVLNKNQYSFHSLRHTAINNLALILNASDSLIEQLTDYMPEHVLQIKYALLGRQHNGQDRWYGLAQVAGHLTPDHTFQHYIHLAHIMIGDTLQQLQLQLPYQAVRHITGLNTRQISAKSAFTSDHSQVHLKQLRPIFSKKLVFTTHLYPKKLTYDQPHSVTEEVKEDTEISTDILFNQLPGSAHHPLTMTNVHATIRKIELGMSIEAAAASFFVPIELVEQWHNRAAALAVIETQKGKLKLFEKKRIINNGGTLLLPAKPSSEKEQLLLSEFFRQAALLHQNDPKKLHQFLSLFLLKVSATKAEFRFTSNQIDELKLFFDIGLKLISVNNWRLKAENLEACRALKKQLGMPASLTIDIHKSTTFKGYSLSITHPDEKKMLSKMDIHQNFSSGILKYGCHMLLIADLDFKF